MTGKRQCKIQEAGVLDLSALPPPPACFQPLYHDSTYLTVVIHDIPPQKHFWIGVHFVSCVVLLPLLLLFFENYLPALPRTSWNAVNTFILIYTLGKTWSQALFKIDTIIRTKMVMIILITLILIILINLRPPCPANFNLIVKSIPDSHNFFFALVSHFYRKLIKSGTWEKWHLRGVKLGKQQKIGKGDRCDLFALLGAWKIG